MRDDQTVPGTRAHFVVKTLHIKPNLDTPDVLPSCTLKLALAFLPLLKHLCKSLFDMAVKPALMSCWISSMDTNGWPLGSSWVSGRGRSHMEQDLQNIVAGALFEFGSSSKTAVLDRRCDNVHCRGFFILQSLPPNGINQMLRSVLHWQICGAPHPSCWKKQPARPSAQILWPANSSCQVMILCTIWKTDVSPQDHRQRPKIHPQ